MFQNILVNKSTICIYENKKNYIFVIAEPFIEEGFKIAPTSAHLIEVEVGDRP